MVILGVDVERKGKLKRMNNYMGNCMNGGGEMVLAKLASSFCFVLFISLLFEAFCDKYSSSSSDDQFCHQI